MFSRCVFLYVIRIVVYYFDNFPLCSRTGLLIIFTTTTTTAPTTYYIYFYCYYFYRYYTSTTTATITATTTTTMTTTITNTTATTTITIIAITNTTITTTATGLQALSDSYTQCEQKYDILGVNPIPFLEYNGEKSFLVFFIRWSTLAENL